MTTSGQPVLNWMHRKRCPFHVLEKIRFDYFNEVWITGEAFQTRDHIVLRLFKTGDAPTAQDRAPC